MKNRSYLLWSGIVIFFLYFVYRLYDQSQLLFSFPLDTVNDMASYMTQLFFLDSCGFHQFCPYWYSGFTSFLVTPPGWFFFAYPLYLLFGSNVQIAFYVSLLLIYCIGFLFIYYFGKRFFQWDISLRILFFLLLFATPFALGDFIRLGRVHELLAWVLFVPFAFFILYYKDKPFDKTFFISVTLLFAGILLTYYSVVLFASVLLFSLFLVKRRKERYSLVLVFLMSILLTSFWTIPFLLHLSSSSLFATDLGAVFPSLLSPVGFVLLFFPVVAFVLFYLYRRYTSDTFLFWLPSLLLLFLFWSRLTQFLPFFRNVTYSPYVFYFSFLVFFWFFVLHPVFNHYFNGIIFCLALASVLFSHLFTPYFVQMESLPQVAELTPILSQSRWDSDLFYITGDWTPLYGKTLHAYLPLKFGIRTIHGYYSHIASPDYLAQLHDDRPLYESTEACGTFKEWLTSHHVTHILVSQTSCFAFERCGFTGKEYQYFCLFSV